MYINRCGPIIEERFLIELYKGSAKKETLLEGYDPGFQALQRNVFWRAERRRERLHMMGIVF